MLLSDCHFRELQNSVTSATTTMHSKDSAVETGEVIEAFAAMVRNGLIMLIGDSAWHYQKEALSGMDLTTRLVINLHPDSSHEDAEAPVSSDLRVAVHHQDPQEFLSDVRHHLMNMVVTDSAAAEPLAEQIQSMLVEGGCWVILDSCGAPESIADAFHSLRVGTCLLLVKKSAQLSKVRRGGRRARLTGET